MKQLILILLIAFSTITFAADAEGTGSPSTAPEVVFCKADAEGTGQADPKTDDTDTDESNQKQANTCGEKTIIQKLLEILFP